jgi:HNH endonuclease
MSIFSDSVREQVRQRAGNRCEYCQSHQDYLMGWLQIDHILPVAKGGATLEENLCLACELCNQYKWTQTEAVDQETQETCILFNPRHQVWSEHFNWSSDGIRIIGLTPCGRATIAALKLNNLLALKVRGHWVKAGWHPPN